MCSACQGDYEDPKYEELDAEAAFNESEGTKAQAELEAEQAEAEAKEPLCPECEHPVSLHEKEYGCEYEADRGGTAWRCGCTAVIRG